MRMNEIDAFREQLAIIKTCFGDKQILTIPEVENLTGWDRRTCEKYLGVKPPGIAAVTLAHRLLKLSKPGR